MKFKITWPTGILIAIASFIIFILSFVYKVTFMPQYDHKLVSEDYYKDELNYQQEINKLKRASALKDNIKLQKLDEGLLIVFPSEFKASDIKGNVYFQRMSDDKIDFSFPIELTNNTYLIKKETIVPGRWDVKIDWTANNTSYLYKEKITY